MMRRQSSRIGLEIENRDLHSLPLPFGWSGEAALEGIG